ncbi:globin domain-containing protein [Sinomonas sp. JGH33]|uniref:nitric oxide dioxygenase n=1 Tax=Sinomonas terricola TaxID=3110330 RepID=A0ABU5TBC9_9MICC|nr:globin domain-containing protein [Sinomonas sp. JGH33]MEA5456411.1 globin domain-containing protein [Sinomonas sp. JGH33]
MLSDTARPVIEATLPLVGSRIGEITPLFYKKMFAAHPELLNGVFSRANQANGEQRKALAGAIAAFATHLVAHPGTLPEAVLSRIAHKHASLGITEDQYPIVYQHLFEAIAEDLGDAVTPEVAAAWTEVYWLMADALIKLEKGLYARQANNVMWAPWKVIEKLASGASTVTFVLEPADATPVTPGQPGQYVSVRIPVEDGLLQARQYSLSADAESTERRTFTTKYNDGGEVSPILHEKIQVGDIIELSNPYGDVTLDDGDGPLILASAGIGCTPSASILRSLAAAGSEREVLVLHAERSLEAWALSEQMLGDVEKIDDAELHLWLEQPAEAPVAGAAGAREGFMSLADVSLPEGASLFLCGPLPFMRKIRSEAIALGVPARKIHYEVFGPDLWIASAN